MKPLDPLALSQVLCANLLPVPNVAPHLKGMTELVRLYLDLFQIPNSSNLLLAIRTARYAF